MSQFSPEDFEGRIDSLYRLVIVAARRANQIGRPDARALVPVRSKKPTVVALQEVLEGKVGFRTGEDEDEDLLE